MKKKIIFSESYKTRSRGRFGNGMESIYDETFLVEINRGCSHQEFVDAMNLFRKFYI